MNELTVFGKPNCSRCRMTTRHLDRLGVAYRYRDVTIDESAHDIVKLLGYRELPVVSAGDVHWGGYRHERIEALARVIKAAPDISDLEQRAREYLTDE